MPCCLAKCSNKRLASIISSEVGLVVRWMYLNLEKQLMKTVVVVYRFLVSDPLSWAMKPTFVKIN